MVLNAVKDLIVSMSEPMNLLHPPSFVKQEVHNTCADNHARKDHRNEITKDRIPTEEAFTRFLAHIQPRTHYPKAVRKHFCSLHNIRAKTSMR